MEIPFVKLQGNGNDFVLIDEYEAEVIPSDMKGHFAALYCDRRFGIGADGILFLSKSEKADLKMSLFQQDASEAEMCGNGIRCLAKYAYDRKYVKEHCTVETPAGLITVMNRYTKDGEFWARVALSPPKFDRSGIPAKGEGEYREEIAGHTVYAVNTGVPHAVVFVDDVGSIDVAKMAPAIRRHSSFPRGANVDFVQVLTTADIKVRTFERGVEGETLSCGTGSAAAAAVAHKLGYVGNRVEVETTGGPLVMYLGKGFYMDGPAETVFTGILSSEDPFQ
jgi:diaminopimelate epimerase